MNEVLSRVINSGETLVISAGDDKIAWQISGKWDADPETSEFDEFWDLKKTDAHQAIHGITMIIHDIKQCELNIYILNMIR